IALWISSLSLWGQSNSSAAYQYSINLTAVVNDQINVQLIPPVLSENEVIFRLPKIVPGTYSIYDFGRFATDFQVVAKKGETCTVEKLDLNSWKISNAQN